MTVITAVRDGVCTPSVRPATPCQGLSGDEEAGAAGAPSGRSDV